MPEKSPEKLLQDAAVARLTGLWLEERARDIALDLIAAKIKAERGAAEG